MSASAPSKVELRTLLLTDLVDSTRLAEELGDQRASQVFQRHAREARALLEPHAGVEIDKTDGFLLLFERAPDALGYAVAYHELLERLSEELSVTLRARAGMHTGEVELVRATEAEAARGAKPVEVEGIAKPFAARLMSLAGAGQTLLGDRSAAAIRRAREDGHPVDARVELLDHGTYRLKGIGEPAQVFEAGVRGSAPLAPPADGPKAYRVLQLPDGGYRTVRDLPNNLPRDVSTFVGRRAELASIERAFDDGAVLVTLVGPGGCGKTRLAYRYAAGYLGDYPGGAWYGELADARTADDLVSAAARALGVELAGDDPVECLGRAIAGRGRALVVFDNFEQLDAAAAAVVGRWLRAATEARFLVTSRVLLQLEGEQAVPLAPLAPPQSDSLESLQTNDAVRLFVERAKQTLPSFTLSEGNARPVAELVRLLDGLPLALELAAARVRVLPPSKIVERLGRLFDLISGGRRDADPRQRTLRAAIDWSWDLLEPWEKSALAQCSLFRGGFDLEAAEAVLDLAPWAEAPAAMDVVQALIDKSLLRSWVPEASGVRFDADTPWFGLLFSVQAYANEKLDDPDAVTTGAGAPATGEAARKEAELRHARHYAALGDPDFVDSLSLDDGPDRVARLLLESQNVEVALERAIHHGDAPLAAALGHAHITASRGRSALGPVAARLTRAHAVPGHTPVDRARLHLDLGTAIAMARWDSADARRELDHAAELAQRIGHTRLAGRALLVRSQLNVIGEAYEAALVSAGTGLGLAEECGDTPWVARAHTILGGLLGNLGRHEEAKASARRAIEVIARAGLGEITASVHCQLGVSHYVTGEMEEARVALERAYQAGRRYRSAYQWGHNLAVLADVHQQVGRASEARSCAVEALELLRPQGAVRSCGVAHYALSMAALQQGELAEATREAAAAVQAMRDAPDRHELCIALACRSRVEVARGDDGAALTTIAEAEEILRGLGIGQDAEPVVRVAAARAVVEAAAARPS